MFECGHKRQSCLFLSEIISFLSAHIPTHPATMWTLSLLGFLERVIEFLSVPVN